MVSQPPGTDRVNGLELFGLAWGANLPGVTGDPRHYSPRSVTGAYLADGFKSISNACPDGNTLHAHVAEVTGLRSVKGNFALRAGSKSINKKIRDLLFHWILVCTGHPRHELDEEGRTLR